MVAGAPRAAEPAPEIGLGALQLILGSVAVVVALLGSALLISNSGSNNLFLLAIVSGPAFGGFAVCGLGYASSSYDGNCLATVLIGYAGALSAFPLALLGCALDQNNNSEFGCLAGAGLGFLAGYVFGTAIGATVGWHLTKRRRAPSLDVAALSAPRDPPPGAVWSELTARRRSGGQPDGLRLAVPVLSLRF